jgi:hypothetical protein
LIRCLSVAVVVVELLGSCMVGQDTASPAFIAKFKYGKAERDLSDTCIVVFPDFKFHVEVEEYLGGKRPKVYEDSLSEDGRKTLTAILEDPSLRALQMPKPEGPKPRVYVVQHGEVVLADIARGETEQRLVYANQEAPFPTSFVPLVHWIQATISELKDRHIQPMKKTKPTNCWMGKKQGFQPPFQ